MAEDMFPAYTYGCPPAVHERLLSERQFAHPTLPETNVQYICRFVLRIILLHGQVMHSLDSLIGTILSNGIKACSSVTEILQHVPQSCLPALEYSSTYRVITASFVVTQNTASLEHETNIPFTEVTMRHAHDIRMPVNMEVALTHIRITSVRSFDSDSFISLTLGTDSSSSHFTLSFM